MNRPRSERRNPDRLCIVNRATLPADNMIRFVRGPDQMVVADIAHKLPGRGVWIAANAKDVALAVDKALFARAFKASVTVPDDLVKGIERRLCERALGYLSLASKAGAVVCGFEKVKTALQGGHLRALVHASDAAAGDFDKLKSVIAARGAIPEPPVHIGWFANSELSLALGRSNVVHAGLKKHGLTDQFIVTAGNYAEYSGRPGPGDG